MYIVKKKIGNQEYYYLKESLREGSKVRSKTIKYLGKEKPGKKELQKIKEKFGKMKTEIYLSENEVKELEKIKKKLQEKTSKLDSKLIEDMFKDFKTFYIYNSNAIEGNTLTLKESAMLLNEGKVPKNTNLREIYDHTNAREVFDWLLTEKPKISKDTMIEIHKRLMNKMDERAGFRKHEVRVLGANFDTTPAKYIETDVKILIKWYENNERTLNPLVLSAIFHEKFERIHPFYDGNGRTGRMLSNLILMKKNYPLLIIENASRMAYYDALDKGHKASLDKADENYKAIVSFFYEQMIKTNDKIFEKWG